MRIRTAVALLGSISLATASYVIGTYTTPTNSFFMFETSYYVSLGYGTNFDSGKDYMNTDILYQSYEANIEADFALNFEFTLLSSYAYAGTIYYGPILITPFRQYIKWINPLAVKATSGSLTPVTFDMALSAEYDLYFGQFVYINEVSAQEYSFDLATWISDMIMGTALPRDIIPSVTDFAMSEPSQFASDYLLFDSDVVFDPTENWTKTQAIYTTSMNGIIV